MQNYGKKQIGSVISPVRIIAFIAFTCRVGQDAADILAILNFVRSAHTYFIKRIKLRAAGKCRRLELQHQLPHFFPAACGKSVVFAFNVHYNY